jgi:hypothetical protein
MLARNVMELRRSEWYWFLLKSRFGFAGFGFASGLMDWLGICIFYVNM